MTKIFNLADAQNQLASLVDRAAAGEEIVISKDGQPHVKLVAVPAAKKGPREPSGLLKIKWISPDFDDPLPPELLKQFGYDPDP
ncbi:MAG: type II toxin-antitoxin system prevent-host-death family antitoxin [Alphaproteobacteria bacterium]|nr:type II toxin-antitoxin system prevent-host-death family antitoxin [Alphaproteobacteria bacterium]